MDVYAKPLVDADARERAENDLSTTLLVEAAAGTGKTTLLVSRICTIVRTTLTPLSRVAAITFTEKAAGELKIKLRERLESEARANGDDTGRFRAALLELDAMPVSTIHAFCRDLISQRPVEADVDPGFSVCDATTERMLAEEAWQLWIADQFARDCPAAQPFIERSLRVESENGEASLRTLYELLNEYREDLDTLHVERSEESEVLHDIANFRQTLENGFGLARLCRDNSDTLFQETEKARKWYARCDWSSADTSLTSLQERVKCSGNRKGKQANWPVSTLEEVRKYFLRDFEERAAVLERDLVSVQAEPLIEWLKGAVNAYARLKRERSLLDFHDLLIVARNMLMNSRSTREFFKQRYDYLLVDEFQDTDPLQAEIVFYLCERAGRFAKEWNDVEVEQGKLFIVGDPKQSIYRFRRADLDLYGRVRRKIEESGECLSIRMNFRSAPGIIAEVNALFGEWMRGPTAERYEPYYENMVAAREAETASPVAVLLAPPSGYDPEQNADKLIEAEAACIAQYIAEIVSSGQSIPDKDGGTRPMRWRDVGILYFSTTHVDALETALRAREIPYQIAGGRDLPRRTEIQALRVVLGAIDNPCDGMSVIGALRSPFFGCSDEDLLSHRIADGNFDYTSARPEEPHLAQCFETLRRLHEERRRREPSETISAVFEETSGLQVFALKPQGEARVANLLKILDLARAFESAGNHSFHRLVRWLDRLEVLRAGEDDAPIAESGDDVVQLMTFHKAKGLEFPVLVLYRLAHDHTHVRPSALVERQNKAVEFRMGGVETAGYAEALKAERDRSWHETMRLFYVAMTRARDLLVLPAYWSKERPDHEKQWFFKLLEARCARGNGGMPQTDESRFVVHSSESYDLRSTPQEALRLTFNGEMDREALEQSQRSREEWRSRKSAATAALTRRGDILTPSEHVAAKQAHKARGSVVTETDAASFGLLVHKVLCVVTLPSLANLDEVLNSAASEFGAGESDLTAAKEMVQRAIGSLLFQERILKGSEFWREMPFTAANGNAVIGGTVDLMFIENGAPIVVDYKTDRIRREDAEAQAEKYIHQAAAYARAMESVSGRPVPEVILYFLAADTVVCLTRERLSSVVL